MTTKSKKLSKAALKALSEAGKVGGTHAYNLGRHYGTLDDMGLIEGYPFVKLTDAGRAALAVA